MLIPSFVNFWRTVLVLEHAGRQYHSYMRSLYAHGKKNSLQQSVACNTKEDSLAWKTLSFHLLDYEEVFDRVKRVSSWLN
jgi:hypothetical protein